MMSKFVICGCVEEDGLSSIPFMCDDCGFADEIEACESEERDYYIYKEVINDE